MKKIIALAAMASVVLINFTACKKSKTEIAIPEDPGILKKDVLSGVASNVIYATYSDMTAKANSLYSSCVNFSTASNAGSLATAQQAWKDVRSAWEQSEGFLFGPVSVDNIDPRIDTWPIDFQRLDSVLATSNALTATYVDGLEESLKGFHPIEYLLFGNGGTKTAAQFTAREKDFLIALADNVRTLCTNAKTAWDPATSGNYTSLYTNANGGVYPTVRSAYEETIDAMAGICDEVANGKIAEPFTAEDASLEESPFAQNSLTEYYELKKILTNRVLIYSGTLGLLLIIGIYPILYFMNKQEYYAEIATFFVLVLSNILLNISLIYHYILYAFKKDRALFTSTVISAFLSMIFNVLLIKYFGILGASVALLLSYIALTIIKSRNIKLYETHFKNTLINS
jgi:putative iron-regulated protein